MPDTLTVLQLAAHLARQRDFSLRTFGPGYRIEKVIAHLRKEMAEVRANPTDVTEYADMLLLACDGALRMGEGPEGLAGALIHRRYLGEGVVPDVAAAPYLDRIGYAIEVAEYTPSERRNWVWLALDIIGSAERNVPGLTWAGIWQVAADKLAVNEARDWPDWRTAGDGPIEHVRTAAPALPTA